MSTFAHWLHGREHIKLLLHWRWLVLVIAIPVSMLIELVEGHSEGLHLLDEVFLDGLIMPIVTWVVLTFAARKMIGHFQREDALERRQQFTRRLGEHREYYDLAQFLVSVPATLLPVARASLFVNDRDQSSHVADWSATGADVAQPNPTTRCADCRRNLAVAGSSDGRCAACLSTAEGDQTKDYCLVLIHGTAQVGTLRLHWQEGQQPDPEALALLASLASEIAMALARALEHSRATAKVYREAQAHERRRITQALHDSLAQQIFYLNLSLDQLADDEAVSASEAVQRKLSSMREVAADVYEQIRNNLSILRAWEQVNLTEAVSELARTTARNASFSVTIDIQGEPEWLSPHTCENLYSVIREALNNIAKHAHAGHVELAMLWTPDSLEIRVCDDGTGFDLQRSPGPGHYGLALMRETIDSLGGELQLTSSPAQGTTLSISIPLHLSGPTLQNRPGLSHRLQAALELAG